MREGERREVGERGRVFGGRGGGERWRKWETDGLRQRGRERGWGEREGETDGEKRGSTEENSNSKT